MFDIGIGVGDGGGHGRQHAPLIAGVQRDLDLKFTLDVRLPFHMQPLFLVLPIFQAGLAVLPVNHDAAPGGREAVYAITRDRIAAFGKGHHHAFGALDGERRRLVAVGGGRERGLPVIQRRQLPGQKRRHAVAKPDLFKQGAFAGDVVVLQQAAHIGLVDVLIGDGKGFERAVEQALAKQRRLVALQVFEDMPDLAPRPRGHDKIQPGRVRAAAGGRDDLNPLAVLKPGVERRELVVEPHPHALVADVAVNGVGEVHGGGALRQFHDPAFGGEGIDLVREQVDLDVFKEFLGVAGDPVHLNDIAQPFARAPVGAAAIPAAAPPGAGLALGLVQPVRGDPGLGHVLHRAGADLYFNGHAKGAEQIRVQRLIAVALGDGDIVLELARRRFIQVVHGADRAVTGVHAVHDDPKGIDIAHLPEAQPPVAHLLIDAIQVFLAALHLARDLLLAQAPF